MKRCLLLLLAFFPVMLLSQSPFNQEDFSALKYRNVGPSRGGRVTAVAGVEADPSVFYMGATGGGVWKTEDYGSSWRNVSDGYFATGSIGAIRVCQADPSIVYVGTGSDGIRSNVIIGKGVYRSDDAGSTWKSKGLEGAGQIGAVEIDPRDPDRVYVAAIGNPFGPNSERGVFRTTDGGDSWEKVLFISENTGACDLELDPGDPDVIYASVWTVRRKPWTIISGSPEGGVYRSGDGGNSWVKLGGGLPEGVVGKSDLAVCKTRPGMLYVLMEAEGGKSGLYISEDMGDSFKLASLERYLTERPFYYTNIDVDPNNPDILYVNCTSFFRSEDRGKSWTRRSTPHGDNHDMWINPSNSELFIQSNDGGANITRDGGRTWSTQYNQPTAELYQVNVDDQFPYWLYAGQQDNTTLAIPSTEMVSPGRGSTVIMEVGGCETGPAVPKPGNPDIVYSNCKGRFGRFSKITGEEKQYYVGAADIYGHNPADLSYRFQRVAPIIVSPHDPGVVYHGSQYLHMTRDEGVTWETISPDLTANEPDKQVISGSPINRDITGEEYYSTLYAVAESPLRKGVIWTGANDGPVYLTLDGGGTWTNVTPRDIPPGGRVQTIEASPHDPAKAYIAVYRYLLDDWEPYIYRTDDYGATWRRISDGLNGIPGGTPARVVREDPKMRGLLFAGTESGVFLSLDDGASWQQLQLNLPVVPVTDIKFAGNDLVLSTMGRSFWILDDISSIRQFAGTSPGSAVTLFDPGDTYRSPSVRSAYIDYFLQANAGEVSLDIVGSDNKLVRSFTSSAIIDTTDVSALTNERRLASAGTARLSIERGLCRVGWDMRTFGPSDPSGRRTSRGPAVIPGRYSIVLTVDGQRFVSEIEVLPDPRMIRDGLRYADYEQQYNLGIQVRNLITDVRELSERINGMIKPLEEKTSQGGRLNNKENRLLKELKEISSAIITAGGSYPQPMLADQANYLYSMITRTDQKPGKDAHMRYEELQEEYKTIIARINLLVN